MLFNHLRVAFRRVARQKGLWSINIAGLAVGMASFVLIGAYLQDELSFDRHHEHADRIVRITREHLGSGTESLHFAAVGPPFAEALESDYAEIERAVRFTHSAATLSRNDFVLSEDRFYFADPDVFEVFTVPLAVGDPETALQEPNSVVLTQTSARRYFGTSDPMGEVLILDGERPLRVTGVAMDPPTTTHLHFDFLASHATIEAEWGALASTDEAWQWHTSATYLLLRPGSSVPALQSKLASFLAAHTSDNRINFQTLHLQPLLDIHLHSNLDLELEANGSITSVLILAMVALLILTIAGINYVSLMTARSAAGAAEVGIRKALGGSQRQLVRQYLTESWVHAALAFFLALVLLKLSLPGYGALAGKTLLPSTLPILFWAGVFTLPLVVGLLAGAYPAAVLASARPVGLLGPSARGGSRGRAVRRFLVVVQFGMATALATSTLVIYQQLRFLNDSDLGIEKGSVITHAIDDDSRSRYDLITERLLDHPAVEAVGGSWAAPFGRFNTVMGPVRAEVDGQMVAPADDPRFLIVDEGFVPTYRLDVVAGRNLSPEQRTSSFLVNESLVRAAGWSSAEEAVGKAFQYADRNGTIVGVVRDFHLESAHHAIGPLALFTRDEWIRSVGLRVAPGEIAAALDHLEETWKALVPDHPFAPTFLEDRFRDQYAEERRLERLLGIFAVLGMFVAALGLFGLATFSAQQRSKEIGVRKVLGASVGSIVLLISRDFLALVGLALVVGSPLAYLVMGRWLESFAYRTDLGPAVFLLTGMAALALAALAVGHQSIRAARTDPVKTLKYE